MTDRELLELAAKAAGVELQFESDGTIQNRMNRPTIPYYCQGVFSAIDWNPLTDDGDALRLAVTLQLDIQPYVYFNERCQLPAVSKRRKTADVSWDDEKVFRFPEYNESFVEHNPYAATRRAIVKAAADIGRSMT